MASSGHSAIILKRSLQKAVESNGIYHYYLMSANSQLNVAYIPTKIFSCLINLLNIYKILYDRGYHYLSLND